MNLRLTGWVPIRPWGLIVSLDPLSHNTAQGHSAHKYGGLQMNGKICFLLNSLKVLSLFQYLPCIYLLFPVLRTAWVTLLCGLGPEWVEVVQNSGDNFSYLLRLCSKKIKWQLSGKVELKSVDQNNRLIPVKVFQASGKWSGRGWSL